LSSECPLSPGYDEKNREEEEDRRNPVCKYPPVVSGELARRPDRVRLPGPPGRVRIDILSRVFCRLDYPERCPKPLQVQPRACETCYHCHGGAQGISRGDRVTTHRGDTKRGRYRPSLSYR